MAPTSPDPSSTSNLVGAILDGRYRVEQFIARGGMATVYRATDLRLDRTVAIKIMHAHLAADPGFVARFEREARAAARLSHPHLVGVFDQGVDGAYVYLAMEYVPGRTVRDVLRQQGPLTSEQALAIIDPVLEALSAAHAAGFVHRDIKPENILITSDGRIKVADFGLARALASTETSATTGVIMGTVAYLAPEQVERGEADERTDIYATGICLFEMVTGRVPFAAETPLAVAYQHVNSDVPAPSSVMRGITPDVDAITMTATRRAPERRYASAAAFQADISRARAKLPSPQELEPDTHSTHVLAANHATQVVEGAARLPQYTSVHEYDEFDEPRPRWPWVLGVLVVIAGLAAGGWWWMNIANTAPAPNLIGMSITQAQDELTAAGLELVKAGEIFDESITAGLIARTEPAAGDGVGNGASVDVFVSAGPERYAVPDVTGLAPEQATDVIVSAHLSTGGRTEQFSVEIPEGMVVATQPSLGEEIAPSVAVNLIISKGPEPIALADYTNKRIGAVTRELEERGLIVSAVERFSEKIAEGRVMGQSPAPGTTVLAGSSLELLVSKGPPPVVVPNLIDMRRKAAVAELEKLGLKAKVEAGDFTPLNRVISQVPAAGSEVPKGSTVTIRII